MSTNPEQIKADIEVTRAELSRDVDALAETVRPGNVARRQKDKVRSVAFGARNKVGSSVGGARDAIMGRASHAQSTSGDALHSTGEAISSAPQSAIQGAQGNPLAAGLIALGVGWLAGSIVPATRAERQAAAMLKDQAKPLAQEVSEMAKESAQNLQEPAKEAVAQVKATGTEAVQTVKEEGKATSTDVAGTAKESAQTVRESKQSR